MSIKTADPATAPIYSRAADLAPSTWDPETRSLDVVISTGARGLQRDPETGEIFEEVLSVEQNAVDVTRVDAGVCPVLADHGERMATAFGPTRPIPTIRTTIGRVEEKSLRYEPGQVLVRPILTAAEDAEPVVQRIADKTLRSVSAGYKPLEWTESEGNGGRKLRTVSRWMLAEVSFVPIPMDPGAQTRGEEDPMLLRQMSLHDNDGGSGGGEPAPAPAPTPAPAPAAPVDPTPEQIRTIEVEAERRLMQRVSDIRSLCTRHGIDLDADPVQGEPEAMTAIRSALTPEGVEVTIDAVRSSVLEVLAARSDSTQINGVNRVVTTQDEGDTLQRALDAELSIRAGLDVPTEARELAAGVSLAGGFQGLKSDSFLDLGRRCLELSGVRTGHLTSRSALARACLHQAPGPVVIRGGAHMTSDFPSLTGNIMGKVLAAERDLTGDYGWFKDVSSRVDLPDYKARTIVDIGGLGILPVVKEGAEYTRVTFGEDSLSWNLVKRGAELPLTEEMLINDDLNGWLRLGRLWVRSCLQTESAVAAVALFGQPTMGDGVVLFHADAWSWDKKMKTNSGGHQNLSTDGGAPNPERIGELDLMTRKQVDRDGAVSGRRARHWIGPSDYAQVMERYYSDTYKADETDPTTIVTVPLSQEQRHYVPSLAGTAPWVMATDDDMGFEHGYLQGEGGPVVLEYAEVKTDARIYHCRDVFGARVTDPRPYAMNPGA